MKIFLYTAGDADSHKATGDKLKELPPGEYVLKVTKNQPIRSLDDNKYYHWVWKIAAAYTGHYPDDIKKEFYDKIEFFEWKVDPRGKSYKRYKSTADLDDAEMQVMKTRQRQWLLDEFPGFVIPQKKDVDYKLWMDVENDYNKTFSGF